MIEESNFCNWATHAQVATIQLLYSIVIPPTDKHAAIFVQQTISNHRPPPISLKGEPGPRSPLTPSIHPGTTRNVRPCLETPCRLQSARCNREYCRRDLNQSRWRWPLEEARSHPGEGQTRPFLASWLARGRAGACESPACVR